jgi:hypothetical protein
MIATVRQGEIIRGAGHHERFLARSPARIAFAAGLPSAAPPVALDFLGQAGCGRSLTRQLTRGLPGVYGGVIPGHRESPSVRRFGGTERPGVTGGDSSRQLPITRNEGVPGSSPGVGFSRLQGFFLPWQRWRAAPGYETGTSSDRFMIDEGVTRCPGLFPFAGSSPRAGRLPRALRCPRVAASARTSLAWCRGYPAFAIERISLPPSRALRAFARNTRWGSEVLGCMDRSHAAALHRCRSDVGVNRGLADACISSFALARAVAA